MSGHAGYLIWFAAAFAAAVILTPVFGRISIAAGLIDYPSSRRFHLTTMPMMGGLAIATAFTVVALIAFKGVPPVKIIGSMVASVLLLVLGLSDDFKSIRPKVKLAGQAAAGIILLVSGLHVSMTGIKVLDWAITIIWVSGIVNCLNLLDNIDGLSGGTSAIAGCAFFVAAVLTGRADVAITAAVFSGACTGFLFHNFHPATIFSGDAGSMFMGSMLASFGLIFMGSKGAVSQIFPGVILGLLIFDTGLVTIMRISHGKKITDGGKDHTSHRLTYLGLSVQAAVSILFAVCFIFGAAGILMLRLKTPLALLVPLILFVISAVIWFLMRNLYNYDGHAA